MWYTTLLTMHYKAFKGSYQGLIDAWDIQSNDSREALWPTMRVYRASLGSFMTSYDALGSLNAT